MSSPPRLGRRRKKEDSDVRIGKEVMSWMRRQNQAVFMYYYTHSRNGGGGSICSPIRQQLLLNYIVTLDLFCYAIIVIVFGNKAQTL